MINENFMNPKVFLNINQNICVGISKVADLKYLQLRIFHPQLELFSHVLSTPAIFNTFL